MRVRLPSLRDTLIAAAQAVLLATAVAALGGFGWLKYEEHAGQTELRQRFDAMSAAFRSEPDTTSTRAQPVVSRPQARPSSADDAREKQASKPFPDDDALIGRLVCDRIGLDVIVVDGLDRATLRSAAGRDPRSARPGEKGNVAIAAHRDTYFEPLRRIDQGDEIRLETPDGRRYSYVVEWIAVVEPTNVRSLEPTAEPALTLVTCFPFDYLGSAPRRYIVRAVAADSAPGA